MPRVEKDRKSLRLPLTATVKIDYTHGVSYYACTRDVNREGMGLYSCSSMIENAELRLEIAFKDIRGESRIETVRGRVEWKYKWNWIYVLGIRFNKALNHEETPALLEYVERLEKLIHEVL